MTEKEYVKKKIVLMAACFISSITMLLAIRMRQREFNLFGININHLVFILIFLAWASMGYYLKLRLIGRLKEINKNKFDLMNLELKCGGEGPKEAVAFLKFIFSNDDFGDAKIKRYKVQMRINIISSPFIFIFLLFLSSFL